MQLYDIIIEMANEPNGTIRQLVCLVNFICEAEDLKILDGGHIESEIKIDW